MGLGPEHLQVRCFSLTPLTCWSGARYSLIWTPVTAFCRFGAKAKEIFARSTKAKKGGGKSGDKEGGEGDDGEEDEEGEEGDEGEEGEGTCGMRVFFGVGV
jgi:hypothetical protein